MTRTIKRLLILGVYLSIIFMMIFFAYYALKERPSCTDGKQNQQEAAVDCGGPCHPCSEKIQADDLVISEKYFVFGGQSNKFDVMVKVNNPNDQYGAREFEYSFQLLDAEGSILSEKKGASFILPRENKYLIELNLLSSEQPASMEFKIGDIQWEKFFNYEEPRLKIYNKKYDSFSDKNKLFGLVKNESYFDFNSIEIDIILRDANDKPLALGKNEMRTVNSQEERDFKMIWPYRFYGEVVSVEVRAEADVFNSENFRKKYIPKMKFQEY